MVPSLINVEIANQNLIPLQVILMIAPQSDVQINFSAPVGWDGSPLAVAVPTGVSVNNTNWNNSQKVVLKLHRANQGNFYLRVDFMCVFI